jgi:hypothetical protein
MRAAVRAEPVHAVEVAARRPKVLDAERVLLLVAERGQVECDVVVDELAEIGEAAGDLGVVAGGVSGVVVDHRGGQRLQLGVARLQRIELREHAPEHAGVLVAGQRVQQLAGGVAAGDAVAGRGLHSGCRRLELGDLFGEHGGRGLFLESGCWLQRHGRAPTIAPEVAAPILWECPRAPLQHCEFEI